MSRKPRYTVRRHGGVLTVSERGGPQAYFNDMDLEEAREFVRWYQAVVRFLEREASDD